MFLGTDFDPSSFPWVGRINYYENIGTDANEEVVWQKNSSDFLNNSEFAENNLHPDFVDIDSITYTLDPNQLEKKIKAYQAKDIKVKAVILVMFSS